MKVGHSDSFDLQSPLAHLYGALKGQVIDFLHFSIDSTQFP